LDASLRRSLETARTLAIVAAAVIIGWALYLAREALLLIYISALLATGFSPLIAFIERQRVIPIGARVPRWLTILVFYLVFLSVVTGIALMVVPPLVYQATDLWARMPASFSDVQSFLLAHHVISHPVTLGEAVSQAPASTGNAVATVLSTVWTVVGGIIGLVTIFILTFYLMVEAESIMTAFARLFPADLRSDVIEAERQVARKVSAWLNGHLMLALVVGTLVAAGLFVIGVPYFYVIALVAALGELVPMLGPIVAGLVATGIALTVSLKLAAAALLYFLVLQLVESNLLVPKIMERQVGLGPVAVIVALMIGGAIHGIIGAVLAIPTTAILKVVYEELTAAGKRAEIRK
jgi:predicted PurR-regulated permease PerM